MDHDTYTDDYIRGILRETRTIGLVGASANWNRPSFFAMKYLQTKNFRVIPVNPGLAGQTLLSETVFGSLTDAIAIGAKTVWMQLSVRNDGAAKTAEAAGLKVVMNRCPKIEYARLSGELSWNGFNSRVITSKRRRM
jgi:predicted CoA-binding protein